MNTSHTHTSLCVRYRNIAKSPLGEPRINMYHHVLIRTSLPSCAYVRARTGLYVRACVFVCAQRSRVQVCTGTMYYVLCTSYLVHRIVCVCTCTCACVFVCAQRSRVQVCTGTMYCVHRTSYVCVCVYLYVYICVRMCARACALV